MVCLVLIQVQEMSVQREFEFLHDTECPQELFALLHRAHFVVHHTAQRGQGVAHCVPLCGGVSNEGDVRGGYLPYRAVHCCHRARARDQYRTRSVNGAPIRPVSRD